MSRLRLFRPQADFARFRVIDEEPVILRFPGAGRTAEVATLHRARKLHSNARCRFCNRPTVRPVEYADACLNRNNRPIPGTATLAGFYCTHCEAEWSA